MFPYPLNLLLLSSLTTLLVQAPAFAQITPDNSLGKENSHLRQDIVKGIPSTIIEKGARRGANLFHSFSQFNIAEGRGAYFSNPTGVENIFSRVTGNSPSNLLGILGVLGNANLLFINPNGIIFGQNAELDLKGAFTASTADSIIFDNNFEFSASNPQSPPLLTVNIPVGLGMRANSGNLSTQGNLTTANTLTLSANNLSLSGNITAAGDVNLEAENILTIQDSVSTPSVTIAGGNLLIQGNQGVDITATNHPSSIIAAGNSITLRSANPIKANGYFWSGGNFGVENIEGNLGNLQSSNGLLINSLGDVYLNSYLGRSLQIIAGGAILIPDYIWITGNNYLIPTETITLSNVQQIEINGSTENLLDLRAGIAPYLLKNVALNNQINTFSNQTNISPANADITIGTTIFRSPDASQLLGGKVLLTNQYNSNPTLTGNITALGTYSNIGAIETTSPNQGGTIAIDSKGSLNVLGDLTTYSSISPGNMILNSGTEMNLQGLLINNYEPNENNIAGKIQINSGKDILILGELWNFGGDIDINGGKNIDIQGELRTGYSLLDNTGTNVRSPYAGKITMQAQGDMTITGIVGTQSSRRGGDIRLHSGGDILLKGASLSTEAAPGGKIEITAENLTLMAENESDIPNTRSTIAAGIGIGLKAPSQKAGDIDIKVNNQITMTQAALISNWLWNDTEGDGGNLNLDAKYIEVKSGSQISTVNQGAGKIGDIFFNADHVKVDGSITIEFDDFSTNLISRVYSNAYETEQGNSGNITINTKTLAVTNGADMGVENFVNGKGNGGNIVINATESVLVDGEGVDILEGKPIVFGSQIASNLGFDAIGKAGNINITTPSLTVSGGARISGSVYGKGEGAKITLNANSILIEGEKSDGFASLIDSSLQFGQGKGGDIEINADSLTLSKGAQISASSFAKGDGGNIVLNVPNIVLQGETSSGEPSILGTGVGVQGEGKGGTITIKADTLEILNGAQVQSILEGKGSAGEIDINANQIKISGATSIGATGGISSQIGPNAQGNAGTIKITADSLLIDKSAGIDSATFGKGNAGSIFLVVDSLKLDHADITTSVEKGAQGNGGEIIIHSNNLDMSNVALLSVSNLGMGNGGNITINSDSLNLLTGAQIQAATFQGGKGDAGNITINAPNILLTGEDSSGEAVSVITTAVEDKAFGDSGDITINTHNLSLTKGGQIQASMLGKGDAGNIVINSNAIQVDGEASDGIGSGIVSSIGEEGKGEGGSVNISSKKITVTNGAYIGASTNGVGNGGNIAITAQSLLVEGRSVNQKDGSRITSDVRNTAKGDAGDITIATDALTLNNGGAVTTNTQGQGDAGLIRINASENINLTGQKTRISSRVFQNAIGDGGKITINTPILNISDGAQITANTAGKGSGGNVGLNISDSLTLERGFISTAIQTTGIATQPSSIQINTPSLQLGEKSEITASTSGIGDAGKIQLNTNQLNLEPYSTVSAFTQGQGNGGDIQIHAPQSVNLGKNSNLTVETSSPGKAGNITITSPQITIGENAQLSATATKESTNTEGGGSINLNTTNLHISGKLGIFAETQGAAPAGNLTITGQNAGINLRENAGVNFRENAGKMPTLPSDSLTKGGEININFSDNGFISARTTAQGKGGNIDISAPDTINIRGQGKITAETTGAGNAGSINLTANHVTLTEGVEVSASTTGLGNAGEINITGKSLKLADNAQIQTNTNSSGKAGDINLILTDNLQLNNSSILATTSEVSTGSGGNIIIDLQTINLHNNSQIAVNSQGKGNGGSISLTAGNLNVKNNSTISAATASGEGGNINMNVNNLTILDKSSPIIAEAGGTGNGGNITLNTKFLIAGNNSDINANAFEGRGGNINITAQKIFLDSESQITASSQFGIDGVVTLNTPSIDPTRGILNFTTKVVDAADLIGKNICDASNDSTYYQVGRGGLPVTPYQDIQDNGIRVDLIKPVFTPPTPQTKKENQTHHNTHVPVSRSIIPARGWIVNEQGQAVLVHYDPSSLPNLPNHTSLPLNSPCYPKIVNSK